MAAVGPIPAPVSKPDGDSRTTKLLRVTILVLMVGISAWLLFSHSEWFENPRSLKAEVLSWGPLGPLAYILLFAVGPSFLVPGAVMTIAGGLAFGAFWGAIWSLVGESRCAAGFRSRTLSRQIVRGGALR